MKAFPSTLSRNEALSDLRQLVNMITETHPDPYFNMGSQIEFFRAVNTISLRELVRGRKEKTVR